MPMLRRIGSAFFFTGFAIGALVPIFLFVYPAAGISPQAAREPSALLPIVARAPLLFVGPGALEIAGHAIGAIAMVALWSRFPSRSILLTCATVAGITWMVVDVVDNAMAMQLVPGFAAAYVAGDASAGSAFSVANALLTALRLAGHFAGGLWVLGISGAVLGTRLVHPAIGWAGIAVGAVLAANPFIPTLLNVSFLTLPAWLMVFGVALARRHESAVDRQIVGSGDLAVGSPASAVSR